ncbi:MAG: DUF512 domain-containing protein [Lachnospiraceae bacterium]|nr:DUF512 domain-containing protein [Lachnospiraceae bacterium]
MKNINHIIKKVEPGSIAEEMEVEPGDELISINGKEIRDILDYHFLTDDEEVTLLIKKPDGQEWELEIEKDEDEDIGIEFENGLMDDYRSCSNHCIFCFIDQNPKGMRDTLYFKDDDSRLSFLQGNYITLTNMKDDDIKRIVGYRMEPINISVHTTNPELRVKMLGNRFAGEALKKIKPFYEAGIRMNGQIVLCKGVNDKDELRRTISDLSEYLPYMESLSVVPVGLSKYREGLYPLKPFEKEDAKEVLTIIHEAQEICMAKWDNHFVHGSDEWYFLAEEPFPDADNYDGYPQLENGVGMVRLLRDEFYEALADCEKSDKKDELTIACGRLIESEIRRLVSYFNKVFAGIKVNIIGIRNDFFGERITVSGLLTGTDIMAQLKGKNLGSRLLLPSNLLRFGEDVLLDDIHISDIEKELGTTIQIVQPGGYGLIAALLMNEDIYTDPLPPGYEKN